MPKLNDPVERFKDSGFPVDHVSPEKAIPKMPLLIENLSSKELGNLMSRYAAWREYTENLHSFAVAKYSQLSEEYDFEYSKKYVLLAEKKLHEKKMLLESDQRLHELWKKVLDAQIYKDLLGGKIETFTNAINMISREITRRGQLPPFVNKA